MNAVDTRTVAAATQKKGPARALIGLWAAGTGLAVVLVVAAYLFANELSGPLTVAGGDEVTLGNVIGFTLFGSLVGAALAYVVGRFARRPRMTFVAATLTGLAGYAVVPFTAAESLGTAIWLNVFHLVVAIPVIGLLSRYLPAESNRNRT